VHREWNTKRPRMSTAWLGLFAEALAGPPEAPDARYFGTDLAELDISALRLERARLRLAAVISPPLSRWAAERLERVECELEARDAT
jgi:hypothetical protein